MGGSALVRPTHTVDRGTLGKAAGGASVVRGLRPMVPAWIAAASGAAGDDC
jgi:hypothetical protein